MTIFELQTEASPTAETLAKGFLAEANQAFETHLQATYDIVQRFWFRNRDTNGNPTLEGDEPSGVEILMAMGTHAKAVVDISLARVAMLLAIQKNLGRTGMVDIERCSGPYELEFNQDGSLKAATLRTLTP